MLLDRRPPNGKLTEAQVREIRNHRIAGRSIASLAADFRVSLDTVRRVVRRATWKHVA